MSETHHVNHGPACTATLTEPHPDFPGSTAITVTHRCVEDHGHTDEHYCRKARCLRSWKTGDEGHSDTDPFDAAD